MPSNRHQKETAEDFIANALKKSMDNIVFGLESNYNYSFSPSTNLNLVLLTTEFIKQITSTMNSEDLLEPEVFIQTLFK